MFSSAATPGAKQNDIGTLDAGALRHAVSPVFGVPPGAGAAGPREMSAAGSVSPPSVFDDNLNPEDGRYTEATSGMGPASPDEPSYDLKAPPPAVSHNNAETLALRLFSADHLDVLLRDPIQASKFQGFLAKFRPQYAATLTKYNDARKAITAIEYANAVAQSIAATNGSAPYNAANVDERFEAHAKGLAEDLIEDALPAYVTHRLVSVVTESLVKEITGNSAPIMRELIPSLAEVYCVSDPSLPDNPIVYASQEFYNTSQYGREYAIGRNCRFLQGPKTSNRAVGRLIEALIAGQECTEAILNYRRDGTPFMNLLMIAPLYDNKGQVRYFLGCQIDVSSLVEGGRGLDSFASMLAQERAGSRFGTSGAKDSKALLGEFGQALSEEEANIVKSRTKRYTEESRPGSAATRSTKEPRRRIGMDDSAGEASLWPDRSLGPSGRLPGVYQNYLLVRPYPSLRITFTSPALRIPGLLQTKFLDRIGGPTQIRDDILDSLAHGTGVTAKITWLTGSTPTSLETRRASVEGKPRWIHCTPLLGSDERVGVWMIVMVEYEEVTGSLNRGIGSMNVGEGRGNGQGVGVASPRFTGNKLYAEYLRREGKSETGGSEAGDRDSARERREVDGHFRDF
ncbi:hypothetical protein B0A48_02746 [Cryoendolithus antarcticus]|uniref:PAC domain-containing protein n=1 Tax=Cryoendolithus antarcticus TaxID=1507870 RepID=A0A1V8TL57_9PEZI|nr:hypothetical protein B0A48_02746 [Cryoendolithus antarcticus]